MTVDLAAWIGRTETAEDVLTPRLVAGLRATLDHPAFDDLSRPLPQTGHWMIAPPIARLADLGADGHPALGGFLPPVPLPRRMWAGSRMSFHHPLRAGDVVRRRSTVASISEKSGSTGPLVFVDVDHAYLVGETLAVEDRHTLVYRAPAAPARTPETDGGTSADWPLQRTVTPTPTQLFRYSALTFNGHRIHYDDPYARHVEGYAGLVVHGPLIATLLADLCAAAHGDEALSHFAFRALSPSLVDRPIRLAGRRDGPTLTLRAIGDDDRLLMTAQATLR